jgi:hypothetical protein
LDAEREVRERLELVVAGWYDLLALFPVAAEERRIVANRDNHWDTPAELRQNLVDNPRVSHVEADVNGRKRTVTRQESLRFSELALRVWVGKLHESLTTSWPAISAWQILKLSHRLPWDLVLYLASCIHRFHS